jgi:hypothetical protein
MGSISRNTVPMMRRLITDNRIFLARARREGREFIIVAILGRMCSSDNTRTNADTTMRLA